MRIYELFQVDEVYSGIKFKEYDDQNVQDYVTNLKDGYKVISRIQPDIELCENDGVYFLIQNNDVPCWMSIKGSGKYIEVDMLYCRPEYRRTGCTHWLLFSVKEHVNKPFMVDGVTSPQGQAMIDKIFKEDPFRVKVLDKTTGELHNYNGVKVYDHNLCYIVETHEIPYRTNTLRLKEKYDTYYDIFHGASLI